MTQDLPHGYETLLDRTFAQGQDLSGGQWQRITAARLDRLADPVDWSLHGRRLIASRVTVGAFPPHDPPGVARVRARRRHPPD